MSEQDNMKVFYEDDFIKVTVSDKLDGKIRELFGDLGKSMARELQSGIDAAKHLAEVYNEST